MTEAEIPLPPRLPKPETLEAKFKLSIGLPFDPRAKRKHMLVYGFILDWFHSKYGDALASVRHVVDNIKERDPAKKGLSIPHVHSALAELVEWGYLTQDKGAGKRASRYIPVWDLVCKSPSVTPVGNASDSDPSVTPGVNTGVTPGVNATIDSVTNGGNEDPSTLTRSQGDQGTGKDDIDCAPPADGLSATATAQEGFDELYTAYGVKKDKAAARRAYDKLAPSPALHSCMVGAAKIWRDAAGPIERMHLSRWIREERYDEDPKGDRKAKSSAPEADNDQNDTPPEWLIGSPSLWPKGRFHGCFIEASVEEDGGDITVTLEFEVGAPKSHEGEVFRHRFYTNSCISSVQEKGHAILRSLCTAFDLTSVEDTDDLLFKPVTAEADGRSVSYLIHDKAAELEWEDAA